MAAKLACLVYRMLLRYRMKYADKGATFYQHPYRQLEIKQLKWRAASLGYQVTKVSRTSQDLASQTLSSISLLIDDSAARTTL